MLSFSEKEKWIKTLKNDFDFGIGHCFWNNLIEIFHLIKFRAPLEKKGKRKEWWIWNIDW